jgi:hypothetical protein
MVIAIIGLEIKSHFKVPTLISHKLMMIKAIDA